MVFRFTIISDELDDFVRVIEIDAEATFLELHDAIFKAVDYQLGEMTSFFVCNDEWEKEQEITAMEMDTDSEYDNLVMGETILEDILEDEKQKLLLTFDLFADRSFFMELSDIFPTQRMEKAICTHSEGNPPTQMGDDLADIIASATKNQVSADTDELFYGNELDETDTFDDYKSKGDE